MPLGGVGTLLIREGLTRGFRLAAAGAAGVASTDAVYCAAAVVTGGAIAARLDAYRAAFLIAAGALLVALSLRQLLGATSHAAPTTGVESPGSAARTYSRFVVLTAVNPLTLVYFVALGAGVATAAPSWVGPAAFIVAAGAASLAWQLLLAGIGAYSGRLLGTRATRAIGVIASGLVAALGAAMLIGGVSAIPSAAG